VGYRAAVFWIGWRFPSATMVLRTVKSSSEATARDPVWHLGVDDWAWRKGQSYGTILVDLDKRKVVDLLPDRSVEGLQAWLEKHSGMEVITRDRCGIYAEAAEQGAPNAVQVADRFHLFLNLSTAVERTLEERSRELCISDEAPAPVQATSPDERRTTLVEQRKQQRRQRRQERYERSWNCIDGDTRSGPLARKLAWYAKPYAVGFELVSFRSANWLRDVEVTFASSMITYSSVGMKDAITQRFCFVRYGNAVTKAPAKWSPITLRLGEQVCDRSRRKGRNSAASHRSMRPSSHAGQQSVFQSNNGPCLSRSL
jgi:hypothetical protein